jgi:hypothetical protein
MIYSFALIDRVNLGAANTAGMGSDLVGGISFSSTQSDSEYSGYSDLIFIPGIPSSPVFILFLMCYCT